MPSWPFAKTPAALALTALIAACLYHPAPDQAHEVFDTVKAADLAMKTLISSPSVSHFDNLSAQLLSLGLGVRFRAPGTSMHPTIRHGDVITVEPVVPIKLKKGDIILYRFQRGFIAHRIVKIEERAEGEPAFILRGDASATCDAPVEARQVRGKVVCLERGHLTIDPYSLRVRIWSMLYRWLPHLKRCVLRLYQNAYVGDKYCSKDQGASRLPGTKHYTLGTKAKNVELGMLQYSQMNGEGWKTRD